MVNIRHGQMSKRAYDLPNGLNSNAKLFADDMSLFSVVHNITDSANLLNSDLSKINEWALQ